jgi:hypothetical protein
MDWGEVFNDPVLATAILDRLLLYLTNLNIKVESYQLREKRKAGLLGYSNGREKRRWWRKLNEAHLTFSREKGDFLKQRFNDTPTRP